MHNTRLADPFDPIVREMKRITSKKSKQTDEDRVEVARLEFAGGLYFDNDLGPVIPSKLLYGTVLTSAAITRDRPTIARAGLTFDSLQYRLDYEGPRDIDGLWNGGDSKYVSREAVRNQAARIMRTRPMFPDWAVSFNVEFDTRDLDANLFAEILVRAGTKTGIGDWRPQKLGPYGTFDVKITEL